MRFTSPILLLAGYFFLLTTPIRAQVRESVLAGAIRDTDHKAPAGVTVSLHRLSDSVLVITTLSDGEGHFTFPRVHAGNYYIEVRGIGYQVFYSGKIEAAGKPVTLPVFILTFRPSVLNAVAVYAPARAVEVKDGKLIFNVDKSIAAGGSNAFELLKRTPGIGVDPDDNLLLKGSTNVTIMLDGRMTYLSSRQLSTLLKSMPAESIARIEVVSTPSSQYDASGNAGIINIVTHKSNKQGYALDIVAGAGTGQYPQTTENLIGNIRTRMFNFFGSYNYNYTKTYMARSSHRVISNDGVTTIYDRTSSEPLEIHDHGYKAGVDIYLSKNDELNLTYSGSNSNNERNAHGPTNLEDGSGKLDSVVQNHNVTHELATNQSYTLDYLKKLDTLGKQFLLDANYSRYNDNSSGYLGNQLFTPGGSVLQPYQELDIYQPGSTTIRTAKADLTLPFKKIKWAGGLKFSSVTTDNNFMYDSLINGSYVYSSALSNHFQYNEKIMAGWASVHKSIGLTQAEAGLRLEATSSAGNSLTTGQVTKRNYTDLFPYLSLIHPFNENNTLSFSLTRRINRPVYSDLNPFLLFLDKYTYLKGNPYLQPEYAWTGSLSYLWHKGYIATLSYARTTGAIIGFSQQDSTTGVIQVSDYNYSYKDAADFLLVAPVTVGPQWTIQNTLDLEYLSYASTSGAEPFRTSKWSVDLQTIHTFSLPSNYQMELTGHYISPTLGGVYVNRHYFAVDGGWKKTFFSRKLDVKLAFTDLFKTIRIWGYSIYKDANISYYHIPDSRRINLNLVYHFGGKLNVRSTHPSEEQERVQ